MNQHGFTEDDFKRVLKDVAQRDTSADPSGWTDSNPLWGHCTVAALAAQDLFGGQVMRGSLLNIPKYAHLRWHYWSRLPDGQEIDFTAEQYPDLSFHDLAGEVRERAKDLLHEDVARRYALLKARLDSAGPTCIR
jgi:hypothetical protein